MKVIPREDDYFAQVEDLSECRAWADNLQDVAGGGTGQEGWLEEALERERRIPEPRGEEKSLREYSGRLMLRMPRSLHRDLDSRARLEGVSLNQFIVITLAQAMGRADDI